ncbi:putative carboxypeptidase S1 [Mytilinidion resinicola]|uniref:Carboxypeptidase S1 n=1 Tax=Mytilinidion resinicola TaxID=574789 RepID=A0A6A6YCL0_9PEZI|nr:putative carboxypeptidase S1 [Mytilinidion resinicola]KAF2806551.1 putative carboxypeptidase S1 [Mytilinidion resinicola]
MRTFGLRYLLLLTAAFGVFSAATLSKDKWYRERKAGVTYQIFENEATGIVLQVVKNSGICEKIPRVDQYSGYASFNEVEHTFFWFVEARTNPTTAPFAMNLAGGLGGASTAELFTQLGPCHFEEGESTPSISNTYNLNQNVNMIYIDQPIDAGFSSSLNLAGSTDAAAPYIWNLLQAFFAGFEEYENRDLSIITSSYGRVNGKKIEIAALIIGNGWYDGAIQYKGIIEYSRNNTYKPLISKNEANAYMWEYYSQCLPAQELCDRSASYENCRNVQRMCSLKRYLIDERDEDVYDIRKRSIYTVQGVDLGTPTEKEVVHGYLNRLDVMKAIGAISSWDDSSERIKIRFGEWAVDARSTLNTLSKVVRSGVTTLIYAGDADMVDDWFGNLDVADAIKYEGTSTFANKRLTPYAVNGLVEGEFKSFKNLSFLRIYEAGHTARHDQPALAFQVFNQTMQKTAISST